MGVAYLYHADYQKHDTGSLHPECAERLEALQTHLLQSAVHAHLSEAPPRYAEHEYLVGVHTPGYLLDLSERCARGDNCLDLDTMICHDSYEVARLAAGAALGACDAVLSGRHHKAFAAVRPPGHHAESDRAMGFCLLNNVAIAARYAQRRYNVERVLIIDWDVHHGNGTQEIFYRDHTVFYFSCHQWPLFPGTGKASERGSGPGKGRTLNVQFCAGSDDQHLLNALHRQLLPAARKFQPELIIISAGFDAHRDDPLGGLYVTERGFTRATAMVCDLATELCDGRVVSVLEGGYNRAALGRSVEAHLNVFCGLSAVEPPAGSSA